MNQRKSRQWVPWRVLVFEKTGVVLVSIRTVLLTTVLWSTSHALGKTDYPCPTDCDCFVFPDDLDAVHVRCAIDVLTPVRFNLSVISANHTAGLYLQCDPFHSQFGKNYISDFMFSHLIYLEILEIHDCQISDIARLNFYGLSALTKLRIVRSRHLTFEEGVFDELPRLQVLEITGSQFVYMPESALCDSCNLYRVNFTHSRVRDIPEIGLSCFHPLLNLRYIDLSSNFLTQIPADFSSKFQNIQELRLNDNRISKIRPGTFKNLKELRLLSLSKNFLAALPETFLMNCSSVAALGLSTNELSRIPKGLLQRLPKIGMFEARNTFVGDSIWAELSGVSTIEYLDLSYALLSYINSTVMSDLRQLKRLVLSGNRIRELPSNVFQRQSRLVLLYMRNNDIVEIGKNSLTGLRSLQALTFYNNNISTIHNAAFRKMADSLTQFLNLSTNALTSVPRAIGVLSNLASLDLSHNRISSIDTHSFEGLDRLLELHLSNNRIKYVPQNVFQKCPKLIILNLSSNRILTVQNNAFGYMRDLRFVWLENNKVSDVSWVFTNMDNLQFINLTNNQIDRPISPYLFPRTLQYLYLAGNNISSILDGSFENMDQLMLLDLRGNFLSVISSLSLRVSLHNYHKPYLLLRGNPLSCTCNMAWLKYLVTGNQSDASSYFQIADYGSLLCHTPKRLQFHFVQSTPQSEFLCYYQVNCLLRECPCCYFEGCDCKSVCPQNCSCYHDQQWSVHVVNCQSSGLTELPPFLPRTMTELHLDGNQLKNLDKHSFLARHSLIVIFLNSSYIEELDNKTFHGLPKLKILHLNNNNIETLVQGVFNGLSLLEELYLDHNLLTFISKGVLDSLFSLRRLTLQGNQLTHLENLNLPRIALTLEISLSHNHFVCACPQLDSIQDFLNVYGGRVKDLQNLTCIVAQNAVLNVSDPSEMIENFSESDLLISADSMENFSVGVNLLDVVSDVDTFCPNVSQGHVEVITVNHNFTELHYTHIIIISFASVALLIMLLSLVLFAKRKLIQVWLFSKFGMRFGHADPSFDSEKKYDAFISYSSKDEHYVVHELAPQLEHGNPSYKLCLHYRDFPVGASIAENIIEAVESSRRTILVLSAHFLQSEWCRFEFQSAHHRVLKDKMNRLIVILLADVPLEKLDPDLKLYLKTKTYLKHGDPWFWDKLKFALPDKRASKVKLKAHGQRKQKKKRSGQNGIGPSVYVVFGSNSSLHIYEEVQPD